MSAYYVPGPTAGTLHKLSHVRKYSGSPFMMQNTGDGASVVKSVAVALGCLVSNPGLATCCVTLGKLLKLSVPSSAVK